MLWVYVFRWAFKKQKQIDTLDKKAAFAEFPQDPW